MHIACMSGIMYVNELKLVILFVIWIRNGGKKKPLHMQEHFFFKYISDWSNAWTSVGSP